ncbi:MAG: hypothetical protein ACR2M1_10530 [Gemmatimonadaceae bacterium]
MTAKPKAEETSVVTETVHEPKTVARSHAQARAEAERAVDDGNVSGDALEVQQEHAETGKLRTGWTVNGAAYYKTPEE